ncbi:MAG: hypothetical protein LBQ01_06790 [Prevotellaceae bacterium]|nr:hypothetical protein [Prevotellaceae bacterium]
MNIRFVPQLKNVVTPVRRIWRRSNPRPIVIARNEAIQKSTTFWIASFLAMTMRRTNY